MFMLQCATHVLKSIHQACIHKKIKVAHLSRYTMDSCLCLCILSNYQCFFPSILQCFIVIKNACQGIGFDCPSGGTKDSNTLCASSFQLFFKILKMPSLRGEHFISLVILRVRSRASLINLDCFSTSLAAKFKAWP